MADNKTQPTDKSVPEFLNSLQPERKRLQSAWLCETLSAISGEDPVIWGDSMIGFGQYDYHYKSGRKGRFFRIGFAPRKSALTLYLMLGFKGIRELLADLGPHRTSVSCLCITNLDKIDKAILKQILQLEWDRMNEVYPPAS